MNRTLKEATVRRYHYDSRDQLEQHLQTFIPAYDHAKRLSTLKGLTPYGHLCKFVAKSYQAEPSTFVRFDRNEGFGIHALWIAEAMRCGGSQTTNLPLACPSTRYMRPVSDVRWV